jgi:hypothetical protein
MEHMHHHADGGHAYMGSRPALLAAAVTMLAAGLVLGVGEGMRGGLTRSRTPALLFALLPPIGFVVQEHLEQLIGSGSLSPDLVTEPTFVAGLALQLPFAIVALLLTRGLYAVGHGFGRLLARRLGCAPPAFRPQLSVLRLARQTTLVSPAALVPGRGPRAPPAAIGP